VVASLEQVSGDVGEEPFDLVEAHRGEEIDGALRYLGYGSLRCPAGAADPT
jgi:hypothetical protein